MQNWMHRKHVRVLALMLVTGVISACSSSTKIPPIIDKSAGKALSNARSVGLGLICGDASHYSNQVIGDGHCVALIKRCAGAPTTRHWRPGPKVLNSTLKPGTVIATFEGQRYTNQSGQHAAVYIAHDIRGIWVWDQWLGRPVRKRLIRVRHDGADASNTAQAFRVVRLAD